MTLQSGFALSHQRHRSWFLRLLQSQGIFSIHQSFRRFFKAGDNKVNDISQQDKCRTSWAPVWDCFGGLWGFAMAALQKKTPTTSIPRTFEQPMVLSSIYLLTVILPYRPRWQLSSKLTIPEHVPFSVELLPAESSSNSCKPLYISDAYIYQSAARMRNPIQS